MRKIVLLRFHGGKESIEFRCGVPWETSIEFATISESDSNWSSNGPFYFMCAMKVKHLTLLNSIFRMKIYYFSTNTAHVEVEKMCSIRVDS